MINQFSFLINPLLETLYMVFLSGIFGLIIGFPLGIMFYATEKEGLWENRFLNSILGVLINIGRSFPFIILMIVLSPISRVIIGSSIGTTASIVPLSIAAAPFFARIVENSLKEVNPGVIEASLAMGASNFQIIFKVLIPEALPSLVLGTTLTVINLIGYSAMAGAIGGGGLGDLAIRYGFYRFQGDIMIISVIVIIILVQGVQLLGNKIAISLNKNR
ncbi:ABC transporter permease [Clostridium sp. D2Q-14]|uniref:methionine ABC transporter permease n=1 Tax=Anaeromonas gelatinilytica TaxID=2683194 RepID=UPI00193B0FAF|nr:methionine ABC transporter permease [Anaeromonas gelatinilytica]MBS4534828.1 ABC transporter permease [Anaeromonas gelatinilytica]